MIVFRSSPLPRSPQFFSIRYTMPALASDTSPSSGEGPPVPIAIACSAPGMARPIFAISSITFWVRSSEAPSGIWTATIR